MHDVSPPEIATSAGDACQPFIVAGGAVRGRLVRLSGVVDRILSRHQDPTAVGEVLAEAMIATVALASGLKYDGIFTFQVRSDGPVHTLVVDVTSAGALRACATYDGERVAQVTAAGRPEHLQPHLLGAGHLTFTVDQGPDTDRYQGVIELTGGALADSVHEYFRQSEQVASILKLAVAPPSSGIPGWRAAGLLLQRMPLSGDQIAEDVDDMWRTAAIFLGSATSTELFDETIGPERLVRRLFGTLGCATTSPKSYRDECRCSRTRSERIVASFPAHEIKSYADNGIIRLTCEFCGADYAFTEDEIEVLHAAGATN